MKTTALVALVLGLAGCVGSELDGVGQTEEAICGNCGDDWVGANGNDAQAIMTAKVLATQSSNDAFWSQGVANAMQDPLVYAAIAADPDKGHAAMRAIIACAALRGQTIFGYDGTAYDGYYGVAPDALLSPWTTAGAQATGACVTMLANPFHKQVVVYPRGKLPTGSWPSVLQARSTLDPYHQSTKSSHFQNWGVHQNWDWRPGHIYDFDMVNGMSFWAGDGPNCPTPGNPGIFGFSSGDTMIRVCCGSSACEDAEAITYNDDYCGTNPGVYVSPSMVTARCPTGTTRVNVMTRAWDNYTGAWAEAAPANGAPALSASALTPHREGTFVVDLRYRNAWLSTDGTGRLVFDVGTAPFVFKYAYSFNANSVNQQQYFNGRLCATDTAGALNCMARWVGPESSYCSGLREDGSWSSCHTFCRVIGNIIRCDNYPYPVTSYLEDGCALKDDSIPGLACVPLTAPSPN